MSKRRNRKKVSVEDTETRMLNVIETVTGYDVVTNPGHMLNLNKSGMYTTKHRKTAAMLGRISRGIPQAFLDMEVKHNAIKAKNPSKKLPKPAAISLRAKLAHDLVHVKKRGFILKNVA